MLNEILHCLMKTTPRQRMRPDCYLTTSAGPRGPTVFLQRIAGYSDAAEVEFGSLQLEKIQII